MMPQVGAPQPPNPFAEFEAELVAASTALYRVHGIRRCGQHAVINWILRNSGANDTVFLNSCTLRRSAIKTCGQSEFNGVQSGRAWPLKNKIEKQLKAGCRPAVLISYEAGFQFPLYRAQEITQDIPNAAFKREVMVIRSFVNWLPSFIRLMRVMNPNEAAESVVISQGVAYEISRYKSHLKAANFFMNHEKFVVANYDNWYASPEYRLDLLAQLELTKVDNTVGEMQIYGAGSSFGGMAVAANELDIANRWRSMVDDDYARLFVRVALADKELMELLGETYPDNPQIIHELAA